MVPFPDKAVPALNVVEVADLSKVPVLITIAPLLVSGIAIVVVPVPADF